MEIFKSLCDNDDKCWLQNESEMHIFWEDDGMVASSENVNFCRSMLLIFLNKRGSLKNLTILKSVCSNCYCCCKATGEFHSQLAIGIQVYRYLMRWPSYRLKICLDSSLSTQTAPFSIQMFHFMI